MRRMFAIALRRCCTGARRQDETSISLQSRPGPVVPRAGGGGRWPYHPPWTLAGKGSKKGGCTELGRRERGGGERSPASSQQRGTKRVTAGHASDVVVRSYAQAPNDQAIGTREFMVVLDCSGSRRSRLKRSVTIFHPFHLLSWLLGSELGQKFVLWQNTNSVVVFFLFFSPYNFPVRIQAKSE